MATSSPEDANDQFGDIHHYQFTWTIKNVYMCRTLLHSEVRGPEFGENIFRFQFSLTLAQSTAQSGVSGVCLFIHGAYIPSQLVKFHVSVDVSGKKCLLDETYCHTFDFGHYWESPVLITNEQLETETLDDFRHYWVIKVQLIWSEPVEYKTVKEKYERLSEFLRRRNVGKDLKSFINKDLFSDIIINSKEKEIPAHKAILYARCPQLAKKIDSLVSNNTESDNYELILPEEPDVINTLIRYLYSGDSAYITEDNSLPLGIYKYACSMKINHLEWLTSPSEFYGKTSVELETVNYVWVLSYSQIMVGMDEPITINTEPFGNFEKAVFSLAITITPATYEEDSSPSMFGAVCPRWPCANKRQNPNPAPSVSIVLKLDALKDTENIYAVTESIYAIAEIYAKAEASDEILFQTKVADKLTLSSNEMRFPGFMCEEHIRQIASRRLNDIYFTMKIIYSRDEMRTTTDRIPTGFVIDSKHEGLLKVPEYDLHKSYLGWMTLTSDLSRLLMYEKFSDCTIVVEGERLPAHRIILAARSPYFSDVFEKAEQECKGSSNGMEIFVGKDLKNITPNLTKIALEEIYTGHAEFGEESADNIYVVAKFFGLQSLKDEAEDKIRLYHYLYYRLRRDDVIS